MSSDLHLPRIQTNKLRRQISQANRLNKHSNMEMKSWMVKMVEKSLHMGNDIAYIKSVLLKNREKERIEHSLLNIRKNIRIIRNRGRTKRKGLPNSFLKNNSMMFNASQIKEGASPFNQSKTNIIGNNSYIVSKNSYRNREGESDQKYKMEFGEIIEEELETKDISPVEVLRLNIQKAVKMKEQLLQEIKNNGSKSKERWKEIRVKLRERLNELNNIGLSLTEYKEHDIYPIVPYSRKLSYELIEVCKMGNLKRVKELLEEDPYTVYDYDHVGLTPLHWALKRGNKKIADLLLTYRLNINTKDLLSRTPMYFAVERHYINIIEKMLLLKASPFTSRHTDFDYYELCSQNGAVTNLLRKFRRIYLYISMVTFNKRKVIWDKLVSRKYITEEKEGNKSTV